MKDRTRASSSEQRVLTVYLKILAQQITSVIGATLRIETPFTTISVYDHLYEGQHESMPVSRVTPRDPCRKRPPCLG